MKVLLDENLPRRLRNHLGSHEVFTVRYQGWQGLKNGELLRTAENDGFQVFVTGEQTMSYEQNFTGRQIAVVVLSAIEWHIMPHSLDVEPATPLVYVLRKTAGCRSEIRVRTGVVRGMHGTDQELGEIWW